MFKVCISIYFESTETDHFIAGNTCCVDYADTWPLKRVFSLSKHQWTNQCIIYCESADPVEFDTAVAWLGLSTRRSHLQVGKESEMQWLLATLYNTGWMDYCQVCNGRFMAILVLDTLDVEKAYSYSTWWYHCLPWNVQSYGWHHSSFT
jgi:hypothetical protein